MEDTKHAVLRLKDEGAAYIGKGNWEKALKSFQEVLKVSPDDLHALMKVGDCFHKLGKVDEACRHYDRLVDLYTTEGFVVKAIAVHKLILKLKPDFPGGEKRLSILYDQKLKEEGSPALALKEKSKAPSREYEKPPLFSDLSRDEFMLITEKLMPIEISSGGVIIEQGAPGDSIFIIVSGQVSIFYRDKEGNEVWITDLNEGSFFGEFGYFSGSNRFASAKAASDVTLLEIGRADLESVIAKHSRVGEVLLKFYKERILDTLLAISPLFSVLSQEERTRLMEDVTFTTHKKADRIVHEGEIGDKMFAIISGEVGVSTQKEGAVVPLARLRSGDFFGEVSVITQKPRTATVTALTDVRLAEIHKGSIDQAITSHPEIEKQISQFINMRVENTISTIMQFKNKKMESGLI